MRINDTAFSQTAPDPEKRGLACINGELLDKSCSEMTNQELADFLEQGAWRTYRQEEDFTASEEAAKRLRETQPEPQEES